MYLGMVHHFTGHHEVEEFKIGKDKLCHGHGDGNDSRQVHGCGRWHCGVRHWSRWVLMLVPRGIFCTTKVYYFIVIVVPGIVPWANCMPRVIFMQNKGVIYH